jgi:hypothetical protein
MPNKLFHWNVANTRPAPLQFANVIDLKTVDDVFSAKAPLGRKSSLKQSVDMLGMKDCRNHVGRFALTGVLFNHDVHRVNPEGILWGATMYNS